MLMRVGKRAFSCLRRSARCGCRRRRRHILPARRPNHTRARTARFCRTRTVFTLANPVTQMGYQIGTLNKISPECHQRSGRLFGDRHPLPAQRREGGRSFGRRFWPTGALELVGNYDGGPKTGAWAMRAAQSIDDAEESFRGDRVGEHIRQWDQSTEVVEYRRTCSLSSIKRPNDSGPGINQILTTSSRLLDNPDAPISDLGSIVGNLSHADPDAGPIGATRSRRSSTIRSSPPRTSVTRWPGPRI